MDIRTLTPVYSVSPQVMPEDLAAIKAAGFTKIICNRPDVENPEALQASAMETAAKAAGLEFTFIPLTHQTMTPDRVAAQTAEIENAAGPVLAYCASGTRSSVIWSLSQVGKLSADDILSTVAEAGYNLEGLRPALGS